MIKIAIVDDDERSLIKEKEITEKCFTEKNVECAVTVYQSAEWFVAGIKEEVFDIYILDMEMPNINGLDAAQEIRNNYPDPIIIFITNYVNYAPRAFEYNTWRYIPKMELAERLPEAYEKLIPILLKKEKRYFVIKKRGEMEKLSYSDIMYMEKEGKYTIITHRSGESTVRKSLDTVLQELESSDFMMIEKGYIINIKHVVKFKECDVYMRDGRVLPVRKKGIAELKRALWTLWGC